MRIHQYSSLDYNNQNVFAGVTEMTLFDVNHAFSSVLTHDDCIMFFDEIAQIMTAGPGLRPNEVPEDQPVGFRVDEEYFPDVLEMIRQGNYTEAKRLNFIGTSFGYQYLNNLGTLK